MTTKDIKSQRDLKEAKQILLTPRTAGDKPIHCFNKHIAEYCNDTNCAIVFENISHWILFNAKQRKNYIAGRYWSYMTRESMAEEQIYYSIDQLKRIVAKLVSYDLIIKGNHNRMLMDKTSWYALTDFAIQALGVVPKKPNLKDIHLNNELERSMKEAQAQEISDRAKSPVVEVPSAQCLSHKAKSPHRARKGEIAPAIPDIKPYVKDTTTNILSFPKIGGVKNVAEVCSSIFNKNVLEESNNVVELETTKMIQERDLNALRDLNFSTASIERLQYLFANKPQVLEDSIKHLKFDIEVNKRDEKIQGAIEHYFMSAIKRSGCYNTPAGYKKRNPSRAEPKLVDRETRRKQLHNNNFNEELYTWFHKLSNQQKMTLGFENKYPKDISVMEYFGVNIWPTVFKRILADNGMKD